MCVLSEIEHVWTERDQAAQQRPISLLLLTETEQNQARWRDHDRARLKVP
jgi:hypothetical protein